MPEAIDAIVSSCSDHADGTCLVIGLLEDGRGHVRGYGSFGSVPAPGDMLFEIGSVTKVFTTALLAVLAARGTVSLGDRVVDLAPELDGFPEQITLLRLATHTSGLPKMPAGILASMLRSPRNPYANYATGDMLEYLSKHPPSARRIEAAEVNYSNLGMALLGLILARSSGDSYENTLAHNLCHPLAIGDTCIQLTPGQERNMARPHNARGRRGRRWDMPAFAGAGALKSTANDLLRFLGAHLGDSDWSLRPSLQACHTVRSRVFAAPGLLQRLVATVYAKDLKDNTFREGMALGWAVGRLPVSGEMVHWHHGATGGYRAFVGFILARRTAVVVLANSGLRLRDGILGFTATDHLGFAVLEHLSRT